MTLDDIAWPHATQTLLRSAHKSTVLPSWHRMRGAFKRPESHSLLRHVLTSDPKCSDLVSMIEKGYGLFLRREVTSKTRFGVRRQNHLAVVRPGCPSWDLTMHTTPFLSEDSAVVFSVKNFIIIILNLPQLAGSNLIQFGWVLRRSQQLSWLRGQRRTILQGPCRLALKETSISQSCLKLSQGRRWQYLNGSGDIVIVRYHFYFVVGGLSGRSPTTSESQTQTGGNVWGLPKGASGSVQDSRTRKWGLSGTRSILLWDQEYTG